MDSALRRATTAQNNMATELFTLKEAIKDLTKSFNANKNGEKTAAKGPVMKTVVEGSTFAAGGETITKVKACSKGVKQQA